MLLNVPLGKLLEIHDDTYSSSPNVSFLDATKLSFKIYQSSIKWQEQAGRK